MGTLQVPEQVGEVDIEVIARLLYQNFNARKVDESAVWVDDACEWLDVPSGAIFRGPEGYIAFDSAWIHAFPDGQLEITNVIASGDLVATELIGRGTHDGPLTSATGRALAPTGRPVELRCVEVLQVRGGKIIRGRFYYDAHSLLRQLGAAP